MFRVERTHRSRFIAKAVAIGASAALLASVGIQSASAAEVSGAGIRTSAHATKSPTVDHDGFATFHISAPTAKTVTVTGNWGPSASNVTSALSNALPGAPASATWDGIVGPLSPGVYSYTLTIDGTQARDPRNPNVVHSSPLLTTFIVNSRSSLVSNHKNAKHGKLSTLTYTSDVTKTERKAIVWTPPGYTSKKTYPTFYLVHGGGGDYLDWVQQGGAKQILDNLYTAKKLKPMVVVMPDGNIPGGTDVPTKDQFPRELLDNIVPAVQAHYSVSKLASKRAYAGLSYGGFQVYNTVLTHPGAFKYIGVFSSSLFQPVQDALNGELKALVSKAAVKRINHKTKVFRIYIGNKTDIAYPGNKSTLPFLKSKGIHFTFDGVGTTGHNWNTWQRNLIDFAPRLF